MRGFLLRFGLLLAGAVVAYEALAGTGAVFELAAAQAAALAALLRGLGLGAVAAGRAVWVGGARLEVIDECTGLFDVMALGAFLFAYPAPALGRGVGLLLGGAVLALLNQIRLVIAAIVLARHPERFALVHGLFWQTGMILAVLGIGWIWIGIEARAVRGAGE